MNEATSRETPFGRLITSDGWFVLNLAEALAVRNDEKGGAVYPLESQESPFGDFGVNVRVVWPGQPNALYHAESVQEGFLVLAGECTLIVEGEERRLAAWDFFYCAPQTEHVIVANAEQSAVLLAVGARGRGVGGGVVYTVCKAAARYGASVVRETADATVAYAKVYATLPRSRFVKFRPGWLPKTRID